MKETLALGAVVWLLSLGFTEAQPASPPRIATPQPPDELEWPKDFKESLDKQLSIFQDQPISAFLHIQKNFEWDDNVEKKELSSDHRAWFKRIAVELKPKILAALQSDYDAALKKGDFRGATIALIVGNKLATNSITSNPAAIATLKAKAFSGASGLGAVWQIKDVVGTWIDGDFSKEILGTGRLTFAPRDGFRLLRVDATIKNISTNSDPAYVWYALSDPMGTYSWYKMEFFQKDVPEPRRMVDDDFLFLITPGGDMINSRFVLADSDSFGGSPFGMPGVVHKDGRGSALFVGQYVRQGTEFSAGFIFEVPANIEGLRLLMIGSAAVPVEIKK